MDVKGLGLNAKDLKALGYQVRESESSEYEGEDTPPTAPGEKDPRRRIWMWTVFLLLLIGWGTSSYRRLPDPVPANRADTLFSSARAMAQLVEIVNRPHPTGSPEHQRVREYLVGRLQSLGLDPEIQTRTMVDTGSGPARSATVRNILARIPGTASSGAVALVAHYDTSPLSPGAGDGGVGVATILETVRSLVSAEPLRNDLLLILSDGEELGLLGARAFADFHPWMGEIRVVLSAGMRGVSGPSFLVENSPDNERLVRILAAAQRRSASNSLTKVLNPGEPFGFELGPFAEQGAVGISLMAFGGRALHEQPTEKAEAVSERTLQHQGLQLLALTRNLGNRDLAGGIEKSESSRAYLSLPFLGLIHQSLDWVLLVSLTLLGVWVLVVALGRLRGSTYQGAMAGLVLGGGLLLGGYGLGWGLLSVGEAFHPEFGRLETAFYNDGAHFFALAALSAGMCAAGYALARRWFALMDLFLGVLVFPIGIVFWLGQAYPSGSVSLQWPTALSLLLAGLLIGMGPTRRRKRWGWLTVLAGSAAILSLLVPSLELFSAVSTFRGSPLFGLATTLGFLLILPALEWLIRPRVWWFPTLAIAGAALLVVGSSPLVQKASDHPKHSSLLLLVEDTSSVSPERAGPTEAGTDGPFLNPDSTAVRRVSGQWLSVPGPGEEWARSWVPEGEIRSSEAGTLLLPGEQEYQVIGAGPETYLPRVRLQVLEDSLVSGLRHLRLVIRSDLNGEMVGVFLPGGEAVISGVGGIPVGPAPDSAPVRSLRHWGEPEGETVTFGIQTPAHLGFLELQLLEHHLRPWEILGEGFFGRDETLIPNPQVGSDRIIQRTWVVVPLVERD